MKKRSPSSDQCSGQPDKPAAPLITVEEFARIAGISRRQIDRLRKLRPPGFPREFELGSGLSKFRRCPRFKRSEVERWLDSRALW
jgi:predicted DNA-binding transcriptional regulator AlpA